MPPSCSSLSAFLLFLTVASSLLAASSLAAAQQLGAGGPSAESTGGPAGAPAPRSGLAPLLLSKCSPCITSASAELRGDCATGRWLELRAAANVEAADGGRAARAPLQFRWYVLSAATLNVVWEGSGATVQLPVGPVGPVGPQPIGGIGGGRAYLVRVAVVQQQQQQQQLRGVQQESSGSSTTIGLARQRVGSVVDVPAC